MTKRILILCLALVFSVYNTGCSSGGAKDDGEVASSNDESFAEEGSSDFEEDASEETAQESTETEESETEETADAETEEKAEKTDEVAAESSSEDEEEEGEELAIDDPGAEESKQASSDSSKTEDEEETLEESLPEDVASNEPPPAEGASQAQTQEPPKAEEPTFTDSQPQETAKASEPEPSAPEPSAPVREVVEAEPPAPRPFFPLQKVKEAAFMKNGALLNRVYIARQKDTAKSISQKLYGADRTKELKSWNSSMARGVKVGDKIYYASPSNPNDSQMLTYYEDIGVPSTTYTSQPGDNIRRVSKELLGSSESWKEVWSTNPQVESKGDIPAGLTLRYWPTGVDAGVATPIAAAPTVPETKSKGPAGQPPAPEEDPFADLPPPSSSTAMAQNDIPPPPPPPPPPPSGDSGAASGQVDPLSAAPPPPPPPPDVPPVAQNMPDEKPVQRAQDPAEEEGSDMTSDPDTLVAMAFGGILLIAAAVLYVVIRKNRAKRMVDLGQTQV